MKKLLCAILTLCMILTLSLPVFAEGESVAKEITVTGLTLPVANEKIPKEPLKDDQVKLTATVKGEDAPREMTSMVSAFWAEADKPETALTEGKFVSGRKYHITITLEFQDAAPQIHSKDTKLTINDKEYKADGKEAKVSSEGEKLFIETDFTATPAGYSPKVELKTTDNVTTKVYDGAGLVLTAEVGEVDGIEHRYEWYRNEKLLENETEEKLTLVNVADSGDYYCEVFGKSTTDKKAEETSTKSAIVSISITPCKVTLNIHDVEKNVFDTKDPEFTYDIFDATGKEPHDLDKLTGSLARKEGSDVGKYEITVGTLAFADEVKDNYEIAVNTGTLTILKDDQTPYVPVSSIGDLVKITGAGGAKVQISAPKGAIPEGAVLTLDFASDEAKAALEKQFTKKILKGFTLELNDKDGKALAFSKEATLRILIPLTEEEAKEYKADTILAALYTKNGAKLEPKVIENNGTTYISVEIDSLGTVALMEGTKTAPPVTTTEKKAENKGGEEKKKTPLWLWILLIAVSVIAIAVIVLAIVIVKKKKAAAATRAYIPRSRTSKPTAAAPKEEDKKPLESGTETRAVPAVEEKPVAAEPAEEKTKTRRIVPFEDLE